MRSENATPMKTMEMDPQSNCKKQEYQDFHSLALAICDTSMISAMVGVLLKDLFLS